MLEFPGGINTSKMNGRTIPPARLIVEVSQAQLAQLDAASGGLGPAALVKAVALALADDAATIRHERLRAVFAETRLSSGST